MMILPQQDGVCALAFYDDLIYWQLDELFVETCCAAAVKAKREQVLMDMEDTAAKLQRDAELVFRDDRVGGMQEKLFYTMEDEDSSLLANVVSKTSLAFVIISTVVMCLETVGSLQGAELQKFLIFKVLNGLKKQILGQKYQKLYLEGFFKEKCHCTTKQVAFWAHFNNYSDIFLQNSLQDTIFCNFALKFASYAHLIL